MESEDEAIPTDNEDDDNAEVMLDLKTSATEIESETEDVAVQTTFVASADLASQYPDVIGPVEPIVLDHQFYNKWSRLPRETDTNRGDSTSAMRKTSTFRVFPITVSYKTAAIFNAIARDQQNNQWSSSMRFPILQDEIRNSKPEVVWLGEESRKEPEIVPVVRESAKSAEAETRMPQSLPVILESRAQTVAGMSDWERKTKDVTTGNREPELTRSEFFTLSKYELNERVPSNVASPAPLKHFRSVQCSKGQCCKRSCTGSGHGNRNTSPSSPERQQQSMPMRAASFLFSDEVDLRDYRYNYLRKQVYLHRANTQISRSSAKDANSDDGSKDCKRQAKAVEKQTELTPVQFIDFTDVKEVLLRERRSKTGGEQHSTKIVNTRGKGMRIRGKLCSRPFCSIGLPLRLDISKY